MFRFSSLDFRIGARMLVRYPVLTVVSTIAIAVAIALGATYFEAVDKFLNPRVDIPGGGRMVQVRLWDVRKSDDEPRLLFDYANWRSQVMSIELLGAATTFQRNLATPDHRVEPVAGAELTANAFRLMETPALLGRTLLERDEQPSEPMVAVISHRLWTSRFDRDPGVVGRPVKVGTVDATIVGVMPEGFAFPINHHLWIPFRAHSAPVPPREGPAITIFGRLAAGRSLDDASAELNRIGQRVSQANPLTHEHLRPRVTTYAKPLAEGGQMRILRNVLYVVNGVFLMLLAVMATNVATLVFARTATRNWEITVRSALGASRGRIIAQLFAEALVLATVGAVVGLVIARVGMQWGLAAFNASDNLPFWIDAGLSWRTVLYVAALTVFGAAIVGILPALRVTRVNINDALRNESAGRAGLKFGGFWTAVIVVQVAINVLFLPLAAGGVFEANRFHQRAEGIGAERFLAAHFSFDRELYLLDSARLAARARNSIDELERRLRAEPGVEQVAFMDRVPVEDQFKYQIEVDTANGAPTNGLRTSTLVHVSDGFFKTFGTSVIAGRDFQPGDFERRNVLIVNDSFAKFVFGRRNAIGQRVRIVEGEVSSATGPDYYEIVGVVKNFGWQLDRPHEQSAMYRPTRPTMERGMTLVVRTRDPLAFTSRLRTLAAEVDPTIRLTEVLGMADAGGGEAKGNWALTAVAWFIGFIVLLLSASGIHALMSFTVARRTREIGIRVALGASTTKIVSGIFARAFLQIGGGILLGSLLAARAGFGSTRAMLLLLAADVIMLTVGMAACAVPVRRALRINPTEALRAEG